MAIRGIHHVAIHVKDFDKMVQFYKDAFGFKVVGDEVRWKDNPTLDSIIGLKNSAARTVMMSAGNTHVEVFEYFAPAPRAAGAALPSDRGYTHFCVDVTDVEEEVKRLTKLGMKFMNPTPVNASVVKTVYGTDPEGNYIEIQEVIEPSPMGMRDWKVAESVLR